MRLAPLPVLSAGELEPIHQATLTWLETCGVEVLNRRSNSFRKDCGRSPQSDDQAAVLFSRSCVAPALAIAPRALEVFDWDGESIFVPGEGPAP